jgi:cytoskeletal protein CcmA (bactofilin family)
MLNIFKKETATAAVCKSNIHDLVNEGNDYFSDEYICIDEKLNGNLFCAEKVVIEQHGQLNGNITSKTCMVTGVVNGNITSLDLLDIKASAVVRGNIQSAAVNIEPGAVINGYITVGEDIEALTEQWNKTKFSTDDYLTMKLNKEIASLNKISTSGNAISSNPVIAAAAKPLVAAVPAQQERQKPEIMAAKPVLAAAVSPSKQEETHLETPVAKPALAAAAPPKADEPVNNSRWW